VFRRRRQAGEHEKVPEGRIDATPEDEEFFAEPSGDLYPEDEELGGPHEGLADDATGSGPWDSAERYPERQRVDLGSLLVPVKEGQEVQLQVAGEQIIAASVSFGESALQVQAFAAPKSGGLWDDVRGEIAQEIASVGGESAEAEGPFGTELRARVPLEPGSGRTDLQPARYIGVDGPRWLLRGTISGAGAMRGDAAAPLEEIFADVVVVRGDHPAPPRDLLEIQLPVEMRQALEEQAEQAEEQGQYLNPFERGPEITETR
jgi:hypothetical protein